MHIFNIILPVWIVFAFAWPLLLITIFGNFLIDFIVYRLFAFKTKTTSTKQWKYIFSAYFLGFAADFIGAAILIGVYAIEALDVGYIYIYDSWYSIVIHLIVLAFTGYLLYVFNKLNIKNSDLDEKHKHKLALIMAIATAPYTFLIPAILFS